MPKITQAEVDEQLKGVAKVPNAPKVIFPYGFRIVEFNGEKVLRPLSPKEYKEAVEKEFGRVLTDGEVAAEKCITASNLCYSNGCFNNACDPIMGDGGEIICYCGNP